MDELVQLEGYEFPRVLLAGAGGPLPREYAGRAVVAPEQVSEPLRSQLDLPRLPLLGWRVVHEHAVSPPSVPGAGERRNVIMAAPAQQPDHWVLLHLHRHGADSSWEAHLGMEMLPVRPSRAVRRRHLRLTWPATTSATRPGAPTSASWGWLWCA